MTHLSPLDALHRDAGARMTQFAGWTMPLRFGSELAEHQAVRRHAGLFDLSHMGQLTVAGPQAAAALDYALVGAISPMAVGRAKYTLMSAETGGVIDDLIVYRLGEEDYLVIANAANRERVVAELIARAGGRQARITDCTVARSMIAVQGPAAEGIVSAALAPEDRAAARDMRYYRCAPVHLAHDGTPALLARTGYTGEDGFEIMIDAEQAPATWARLRELGDEQLTLCGLAARDTLRLEAAMPLYGHELDTEHTPDQAGLGRVVALDKDDFVGRDALARAAAREPDQVLVGLAGEGKRAPREGYAVQANGHDVGVVTSGALSPTLGHPIALAYVTAEHAAIGTALDVDLRGTPAPVRVVETPFYRRAR